ncbi:hypothetical protein [Sinorhizobium meliloti]|uniref:hypothetical protein n=1 Tax=Rhizobium meliloti TaxID=382 RepID=UPI00235353C3|nr:hypothetical protein [Sinorhizobium meliloti]
MASASDGGGSTRAPAAWWVWWGSIPHEAGLRAALTTRIAGSGSHDNSSFTGPSGIWLPRWTYFRPSSR